jgi:hypothetical protein
MFTRSVKRLPSALTRRTNFRADLRLGFIEAQTDIARLQVVCIATND